MSNEPEEILTEGDIKQAEMYSGLGPEYFAGRRIAERFMEKFQAEQFKPLVDEFMKQFRDKLWTDAAEWLMADTESNIHTSIYYLVERTVKALLTGEPWALSHYPLTKTYEGEKIRAMICAHFPEEMKAGRISDLEEENKKLKEEIKWFRRNG